MLEGLPAEKQQSRILADTARFPLFTSYLLLFTSYSIFPVSVAIFNSPIAFVI
jgi:hypothetical protein